ncbi:MAG: hypothetical protein IJF33_06755 [Clostridia bacterium]|nr:hypothetical protein [Clostridia bacterium]
MGPITGTERCSAAALSDRARSSSAGCALAWHSSAWAVTRNVCFFGADGKFRQRTP